MDSDKSLEQAAILMRIQDALEELDVEFLSEYINQTSRESTLSLYSNSLKHEAHHEFMAAKLKQLRLYFDAAMNLDEIEDANIKFNIFPS